MDTAPSHPFANDNAAAAKKHARALKAVMGISAGLSVMQAVTGMLSGSTSLIANMLDALGDSVSAGLGLAVHKRSKKWQAAAALGKAAFMGVIALGVLAETGVRIFSPIMPLTAVMAAAGAVALCGNIACMKILGRYKGDNLNIKSSYACSRNDAVSSTGVILAATIGHVFMSPIPDLIVGATVSSLYLKSAIGIARESIGILRGKPVTPKDHSVSREARTVSAPKIVLGLRKSLQGKFNSRAQMSLAAKKKPNRQPPRSRNSGPNSPQ